MRNPKFQLWLEFELWEENYNPEEEFFNMSVTLDNGKKYALNVWTYKYFELARKLDIQSNDCLGGKYLIPPDLLIEKLDREMIVDIFDDIIRQNSLKPEWLVIEENYQ